jgi:hypothetical protein
VATPEVESIETTDGFKLLHTPPAVAEARLMVVVGQKEDGPVIDAGSGFTVTTRVTLQPVAVALNDIVALPNELPVVKPALVIDATLGLLLLHVPPTELERYVIVPAHKLAVPAIGLGNALTDVVRVA